MARCNDCNKFVGIEQADPELDNLDLTVGEAREEVISEGVTRTRQEVEVTGEVSLVLTCAECGSELKSANVDLGPHEVVFTHGKEACEGELEIEEDSVEATDRFEGKGRGAKHFYGADISVTITCGECEVSQHESFVVEEQASAFEEV